MSLNRIQQQIFADLGKKEGLSPDAYVEKYATQYLGKSVCTITELSEEEADRWITKAYLDSLEQGEG